MAADTATLHLNVDSSAIKRCMAGLNALDNAPSVVRVPLSLLIRLCDEAGMSTVVAVDVPGEPLTLGVRPVWWLRVAARVGRVAGRAD